MIKRLLQLALPPSMSIFLDVDDMKDIGSLEVYIDESQVILMFVSRGYFSSRNCEREIRQATKSAKHIVLVHEADLRRVLAPSLVHTHASPARVRLLRAAWTCGSCPCPHMHAHLLARTSPHHGHCPMARSKGGVTLEEAKEECMEDLRDSIFKHQLIRWPSSVGLIACGVCACACTHT